MTPEEVIPEKTPEQEAEDQAYFESALRQFEYMRMAREGD